MVRSDQLILAVVGLPAANIFLPVQSVWRQLIGPVHPVHAGVDMVLVAGADLEDASDPVVVRVCPRTWLRLARLLALDGTRVCDKDVVVAEILGAVD